MHKMTGGQGKCEDYLFWTYHGLNVEQAISGGSTLITQAKWDQYQAD